MKKYFLSLLIAFGVITPSIGLNFYRNISARQADKLIREHEGKGDLVILDVRSPGEFANGFLKGAINMDFWGKGFTDSIDRLEKNKVYLVYCASGVRSSGAMKKMRSLGFEKIYNMKGGMFGWKAARMPVVHE